MQYKKNWMVATVLCLALSACGGSTAPAAHEKPAKLDPVGNTGLKKVTLTPKANERIGLQMAPIREEQVTRMRTIGGSIVSASGSPDALWVRLQLNENEIKQIDRAQPAEVRTLTADPKQKGFAAQPDKGPANPTEADEIFYRLDGTNHGLKNGDPALVQLALQGGSASLKVIPSSALLYDTKGQTWVYISDGELAYVRNKVAIAYIDGDNVYLSDGPAAGVQVVTLGAAELYGAETGVGK